MTTNQIFNPSRFKAFIVKYAVENRNRLLIIAGLTILLPLLFTVAIPYMEKLYKSQRWDTRPGVDPMWIYELRGFMFIMMGIVAYLASLFYQPLANKTTRLSLLMSPASQFEKFLTFFCIFIVAGVLLFIGATFLADWVRVLVFTDTAAKNGIHCAVIPLDYILSLGEIIPGQPSDLETTASSTQLTIRLGVTAICLSTFFTQAMFALGSSIWPKNSFVKTICFTIVFWMAFTLLLNWGFMLFFHNGFTARSWWDTSDPSGLLTIIDICSGIATVVLWFVTYFRFKEWEIIKRW